MAYLLLYSPPIPTIYPSPKNFLLSILAKPVLTSSKSWFAFDSRNPFLEYIYFSRQLRCYPDQR